MVLAILLIFVIDKFHSTGKSINTQKIEITPLSSNEKAKVEQVLISSEFVKDIPEKESISLRFFKFENGQRVWQDSFLIGNNQNPSIYLSLHSKYISELNNENLCEIIKKANENKDLGFHSEFSKTRLLIKYASMLKHRKCLGF